MISKDNEFKTVLQLASEQAKIEQKMNALKEQVELQVAYSIKHSLCFMTVEDLMDNVPGQRNQ